MITLLVEDVIDGIGDHYPQFITPPISNTEDVYRGGCGWAYCNQELLKLYNSHKSFCILPIKNFNNHMNPYYLISMVDWDDFKNSNVWENIPKNSLDILIKHKIPVLLWYPLESPDNSSLSEWQSLVNIKNNIGLFQNKVSVLSACKIVKWYHEKKKSTNTENDTDLYGITFIPSVNYAVDNFASGTSGWLDKSRENKHQVCSISDHNDLTQKNKDFICLNNLIERRINRLVLLQSLYVTDDLYEKNIISARWNPPLFTFDQNRLYYNNDTRKSFFWRNLKQVLFCHDKKITSDKNLLDFINVLESISGGDINLSSKLHDRALHNVNKMIKSIKKEDLKVNITKEIDFLCYLILKSIEGNQSMFPRTIPDQDHPDVLSSQHKDNFNSGMLNACFSTDWYKFSWFSIITESWDFLPDQGSDIMQVYFPTISEKTFKAIVNNHPFVIFSVPGTSSLLNEYGFKTFDQSLLELPENFDNEIVSFTERVYAFVESLKKFSLKSHEEKAKIWNSIKPDLIHNSNVLKETDWISIQHDLILKYSSNK